MPSAYGGAGREDHATTHGPIDLDFAPSSGQHMLRKGGGQALHTPWCSQQKGRMLGWEACLLWARDIERRLASPSNTS